MISRSMGRRYSKALLALALESGEPLDTLQEEVESFSSALFSDARTINFLTNPNVLMEDRLKGFDKILASAEVRPLLTYLSRLLIRKGRLPLFPDIATEFQKLVDRQSGVVRASVTSSKDLSHDEEETLRTILNRRFGKKIVLSVSVDRSLIGGLVIKVGSLSFDGSIRSQLKDIQSQLLEEVSPS